jgi:hypothetical protein
METLKMHIVTGVVCFDEREHQNETVMDGAV